mmetsp:Transcript_27300/g.60152  ORF Transcript_27300/g.60152 Transcript_27300/m.60152 type:complete len:223 (-) Transcript_27300:120-788(-)
MTATKTQAQGVVFFCVGSSFSLKSCFDALTFIHSTRPNRMHRGFIALLYLTDRKLPDAMLAILATNEKNPTRDDRSILWDLLPIDRCSRRMRQLFQIILGKSMYLVPFSFVLPSHPMSVFGSPCSHSVVLLIKKRVDCARLALAIRTNFHPVALRCVRLHSFYSWFEDCFFVFVSTSMAPRDHRVCPVYVHHRSSPFLAGPLTTALSGMGDLGTETEAAPLS